MAKKRATLTDLLNDLTYRINFDKWSLIARSSYQWDGLPDGILEKHVERHLFKDGKAIFFRDPKMSFMCLQAHDGVGQNVYGDPQSYIATGIAYHKSYSADDCVIIENNPLRIGTADLVHFYVNKITEAERSMDVNVKNVKTPFIIACDDKDVLTFKRIMQMIHENALTVYADKGLNLDALQVLRTDVKFMGNDLMDYKKSVENELLTILGYDNLAVDKKERVNLSEANSNNQVIGAFADLQLESRQKACELINAKWGLNVSVKRREVSVNVARPDDEHNEINA